MGAARPCRSLWPRQRVIPSGKAQALSSGETERGHAPLGARAPAGRFSLPGPLRPLPLETSATLRRGEERRPLALGKGGRPGVLPPLPPGEGWGAGPPHPPPHTIRPPPTYAASPPSGHPTRRGPPPGRLRQRRRPRPPSSLPPPAEGNAPRHTALDNPHPPHLLSIKNICSWPAARGRAVHGPPNNPHP